MRLQEQKEREAKKEVNVERKKKTPPAFGTQTVKRFASLNKN